MIISSLILNIIHLHLVLDILQLHLYPSHIPSQRPLFIPRRSKSQSPDRILQIIIRHVTDGSPPRCSRLRGAARAARVPARRAIIMPKAARAASGVPTRRFAPRAITMPRSTRAASGVPTRPFAPRAAGGSSPYPNLVTIPTFSTEIFLGRFKRVLASRLSCVGLLELVRNEGDLVLVASRYIIIGDDL